MESIVLGHTIPDRQNLAYFNLLNNLDVGFTLSAAYLLSFFGILTLAFLIGELIYRVRFAERRPVKISKRIALALRMFQNQKLSAVGIFVFFVYLFLWLTQLFLTNNIKTNKVVRLSSIQNQNQENSKIFSLFVKVVDTSQLIKDERDIFSTRRVACMVIDTRFTS